MKRKILAQFLAFGLALTSFPISAYAAEIQENVETKAESTDLNNPESENIWPVIIKQLQIIQAQVFKFLFGK